MTRSAVHSVNSYLPVFNWVENLLASYNIVLQPARTPAGGEGFIKIDKPHQSKEHELLIA